MPLTIRAKGVSLSTATNWAFNYLVGAMTPVLQEVIGWRLYPMHGTFCIISFFVGKSVVTSVREKCSEAPVQCISVRGSVGANFRSDILFMTTCELSIPRDEGNTIRRDGCSVWGRWVFARFLIVKWHLTILRCRGYWERVTT